MSVERSALSVGGSGGAGAVFLSYASQDADPARRICESLRAAGVEVWFDQSELRGGDAWDAKIRKQIKECALFLPIISTNTQTRREGYFRREWKLAVDRTHDMDEALPFLVPVVIDDTKDAEAFVPEKFRAVQWTRLRPAGPAGQGLDEAGVASFCARLRQLLGGGSAGILPAKNTTERGQDDRATANATQPRGDRRLSLALAIGVAAVGLAVWAPWRKSSSNPMPASPKSPDGAVGASAANSLGIVVDEKSIAVLPFANRSADQANAAFTDGVHEDVLTSLFNLPELRVVSRTTVEQYRDTKKPLKQIGQELGVGFVLEGSVQRAEGKVRVTAKLIDARTDRQVWANNYDRELHDIFAIQAEIARGIANELRAKISPQAAKLLDRTPTQNIAAYDKFAQARSVRNHNPSLANAGIEARRLEEAVALDPAFARAWAWLAYSHGTRYMRNLEHSPASLEGATRAINQAVRLAPDDPEVILQRGLYFAQVSADYPRAVAEIERVAQLQPGAASWRWALWVVQSRQGKWLDALNDLKQALQLEPNNFDFSQLFFATTIAARRFHEALSEGYRADHLAADPAERRFMTVRTHFLATGSTRETEEYFAALPPEYASSAAGSTARRNWAAMRGDLSTVVRADQAARGGAAAGLPLNFDTQSNPQVGGALTAAIALMASGERAGTRAVLAELNGRLRQRLATEPENPEVWGNLGRVEAVLGNKPDALNAAQKAVELLPESVNHLEGALVRTHLAFVYAWTGEKERALEEYARLLRTPLRDNLLINVHVMRRHPEFFPLQGDPRFKALLDDPKNNAPLF